MIVEATVTIMVSDVDKALAFYIEVLGLELKKRYSENMRRLWSATLFWGFT